MTTRFLRAVGQVLAWMLATGFSFSYYGSAQEVGYDDDTEIDFVWTAPEGSFDHYNIYVSVDGGEYQLDGTSPTEAYTVGGQNGHSCRIKVTAVTSDGIEGPASPESDPVICDTLSPLAPAISETYDVLNQNTVVLTLESAPTDANFSNYQVLGGQYSGWTDTSETINFTFTLVPDSQNLLHIREKDLAGNVGPADSLTVENLSGDTTPPVITLLGSNPMTLEVGTAYAEPGYTATDNLDGSITANVVVTGSVNPNVPGSYVLRYNVSDSSGNPAQEKTRTVNVVDTTAPTISNSTGNTSGTRGGSVTISAKLNDNVGLSEAFLYYRAASASTWSSVDFLSGSASITIPEDMTEDIYYCIVADDEAGNGPVGDPSADGNVCYTITVVHTYRTLDLAEGWNLVGISAQPLDPFCSSLFGDVAVGDVWGWDGSKTVAVTSVELLKAYWVLAAEPATIEYNCLLVYDLTPELNGTWNMFAVAEQTPYPLPFPNAVGSAWGWDGTKYVRVEGFLQPDKGYWIAAESGAGQDSAPLRAETGEGIFGLTLNMELSGIDKGSLEIGLLDALGPEVLDTIPPASPDGFSCYILEGRPSPFKGVSKSISVLAEDVERRSWFVIAEVPAGKDFSLFWDSSTLPPNAMLTITELDVVTAMPKSGSISMTETEVLARSATSSSIFAWKVEATCRARDSQDADGDLIADDWEQQNFPGRACDPYADPDGDRMSNLQEFIAGTDPNDVSSVLAISVIQKNSAGNEMLLSWKCVLGRKYQVLYCDSLLKEWRCLGTEIQGTGDTMLLLDNAISSGERNRFYQVRGW